MKNISTSKMTGVVLHNDRHCASGNIKLFRVLAYCKELPIISLHDLLMRSCAGMSSNKWTDPEQFLQGTRLFQKLISVIPFNLFSTHFENEIIQSFNHIKLP